MGIQTNIHIGVYLDITTKQIKIKSGSLFCPAHKKRVYKQYEDMLFCPKCGVKLCELEEIGYCSFYDLVEDKFEDELQVAYPYETEGTNKIYAISNYTDYLTIEEMPFEISANNKSSHEIQKFKTKFKIMLQHLKKHQLVESLKIKYGVLHWMD